MKCKLYPKDLVYLCIVAILLGINEWFNQLVGIQLPILFP